MTDSLYNLFISACLSAIAFFLIRFYYLVDEIRKDVKGMLISEARKDAILNTMQNDITDIKDEQHEQNEKLRKLELEIEKLKK